MIRTQIYIPKAAHLKLANLSRAYKEPIAKIVRDFIDQCLRKVEMDYSGKSAMQAISGLKLRGGPKDLSANLDNYLYGARKD